MDKRTKLPPLSQSQSCLWYSITHGSPTHLKLHLLSPHITSPLPFITIKTIITFHFHPHLHLAPPLLPTLYHHVEPYLFSPLILPYLIPPYLIFPSTPVLPFLPLLPKFLNLHFLFLLLLVLLVPPCSRRCCRFEGQARGVQGCRLLLPLFQRMRVP